MNECDQTTIHMTIRRTAKLHSVFNIFKYQISAHFKDKVIIPKLQDFCQFALIDSRIQKSVAASYQFSNELIVKGQNAQNVRANASFFCHLM